MRVVTLSSHVACCAILPPLRTVLSFYPSKQAWRSFLGSEVVRRRTGTVKQCSQGWEDLTPVEMASDYYSHPLNTNPTTVKTSGWKSGWRPTPLPQWSSKLLPSIPSAVEPRTKQNTSLLDFPTRKQTWSLSSHYFADML